MIIGIYLIAFSIVGPLVLIFWLSDLIDNKSRDRKYKKMAEQAAKENADRMAREILEETKSKIGFTTEKGQWK